jgi:hypothetical protein
MVLPPRLSMPGFEGKPGAQRRLLEKHHHLLARQNGCENPPAAA